MVNTSAFENKKQPLYYLFFEVLQLHFYFEIIFYYKHRSYPKKYIVFFGWLEPAFKDIDSDVMP